MNLKEYTKTKRKMFSELNSRGAMIARVSAISHARNKHGAMESVTKDYLRTSMMELLTDLMHMASREGISFADELVRAGEMFRSEVHRAAENSENSENSDDPKTFKIARQFVIRREIEVEALNEQSAIEQADDQIMGVIRSWSPTEDFIEIEISMDPCHELEIEVIK